MAATTASRRLNPDDAASTFQNLTKEIIQQLELAAAEAERLKLDEAAHDLRRALSAAGGLAAFTPRLPDLELSDDPEGAATRLRHDLRTPMSAIIGNGEMALEELDDGNAAALQAAVSAALQTAELMLSILSPGDADAEAAAAGTAGTAAQPTQTGRILVVDDDADSRDLLCRRLTRQGHRVVVADSGAAALAKLAESPVDLVLLDLIMPNIDGFEALTRIKADARFREIPVLMISGLQEMRSVIRCIEAGAEDYLTKPVNSVLLQARVNACLDRKHARDRERDYFIRLAREKERADALLRSILPGGIVARLNGGEAVIADRFEAATILFCDIVAFTELAARTSAVQLVEMLDRIFSAFDALCADLGIEKIKTIGDAYMAASGLPSPRPDHAAAAVRLGLAMIDAVEQLNQAQGTTLQVRIGAHSGVVVGGVIGRHRFIYDVWGDTVNIASRLESSGVPGRVQVSKATREGLGDDFSIEPRGAVPIKGRGRMKVFLIGEEKTKAAA